MTPLAQCGTLVTALNEHLIARQSKFRLEVHHDFVRNMYRFVMLYGGVRTHEMSVTVESLIHQPNVVLAEVVGWVTSTTGPKVENVDALYEHLTGHQLGVQDPEAILQNWHDLMSKAPEQTIFGTPYTDALTQIPPNEFAFTLAATNVRRTFVPAPQATPTPLTPVLGVRRISLEDDD